MIDTFSVILEPLKVFNSIADDIADLHPYANATLSTLTCASKMILNQANLNGVISNLLSKVSNTFILIIERDSLAKMSSMLAVYTTIAQHLLECAEFIVRCSLKKNLWQRLGKHARKGADAEIDSYLDLLEGLMRRFRDEAKARDLVEGSDLDGMGYAASAGLIASKCCLHGTRVNLLTEIKSWICSTGEDVPRVLWLSGAAGKGKSAVAHTISNWSNELGGLGAFFSFDRTRRADRRHEKIFTTIARDLGDRNPIIRQALASALIVNDDEELRQTTNLINQWQRFVIQPIGMASRSVSAPVLIVIDALDESGEAHSREVILRVLAGKLPSNFRIIVTSRPLEDICDVLNAASHVRRVSMDDVPTASAEHDIQLYVSTRLADPSYAFDDAHFKALAQKSDGLFEWARLACEYIKSTPRVDMDPMNRFKAVVAATSSSSSGTHLLDAMYGRILREIVTEDEAAVVMFRSVMGQIFGSFEPLSMTALTAMRLHFPSEDSRYEVERVIKPMGPLVTGTVNPHSPICPLHASFYDFLTDRSRSEIFFIDVSLMKHDLTFASLRVMKAELRFNICSLESSYLPNSAVLDLEKRVQEFISAELSYSCRFWGTHVRATSFEPSLAKEVEAFFGGERLLFWLEALALMKHLSGTVELLSSIADWLTGHAEYVHLGDAVRDTQHFVRTFQTAILHSTPHLYLSALPFAPTQSRIFKNFATNFPSTPQVVAGHVVKWPFVDKKLDTHAEVQSVVFSPDGKIIVCGAGDGTIQLWDAETGKALGDPLRGHTASVRSVAISPDGHHIVSASWDKTIRVWDIDTHETLGFPIRGHTDYIECVAISPDGRRIVSSSWDKTIRVWDMQTGEALGAPLEGHTNYVWSVAISPDGKRIVSSSDDKTIRMWDMETGKALGAPLEGHLDRIRSVAISPDGKRIVSGGSGREDTTLRTWDAETGKALSAPFHGHFGDIWTVAISLDGMRIVSGSIDKTIRVWDIETGQTLGDTLRGHLGRICSVAISPDGQLIASGSDDKMIRVWNADTGKADIGRIWSVAISPDGKRIVSGSDDTMLRVWDAETGKTLGAPLRGHLREIRSVAISPDGQLIVSGSEDETIRVWDAYTGEALGDPLRGHFGPVVSVAISPDGKRIVSGSNDKTIRVWDMETGDAVGLPLRGHTQFVQSVAISPDGKRIVSSSGTTMGGSADGMIQLWDAETGEALSTLLRRHTACVRSIAISLDGKRIVSGSGDTTQIWNAETGELLSTPLRGRIDYVHSVAISPDGKRIMTGDDTFRVWDADTGEALNIPLRANRDDVLSVAISADGQHIVSGSSNKTIRVWDPEFLRPHQPFKPPAIHFSSNRTHALCCAPSFLQGSSTPASLILTEEGWIIGPTGRLLLWIPANFYPVMYVPGNTLVIPNDALQLDLSCFAHGTSWPKCREQALAADPSPC
ncbi:hypothetical protein AZE42_06365 [Rhizopogon vesiculosus]|uniref:Nephrocystin 3-like N-terminal domain-containing protein n=1 Tax=Rhizopogon vesiculosus TaxID=180088 RepID=A0A1J8Q1K9_9AGAM|nr:hypothetical protein AZE42_06365 [Rhizopogon vesiculosus]